MKMYANLHIHSTHSDGKYTPEKIVEIAKKEGYKAVAITDHDTATAYPELKRACEKNGLECIFGVEFSVFEDGENYHITAFNFDPEYPPMKDYLEKMALRQTDNTLCCFNEAVENGNITGITWEEVLDYNKGVKWLCNEHVFRALKAKNIVKDEDYYEWFLLNFKNQRKKYPPIHRFNNLEEMIKLIHDAGGIAILAHPCSYNEDFREILKYGLDGIEVWHHLMSDEMINETLEYAKEKGFYISGGSDHGGLCGGLYSSFKTEEELKQSEFYVPECTSGTTKEFYEEIKNMSIKR